MVDHHVAQSQMLGQSDRQDQPSIGHQAVWVRYNHLAIEEWNGRCALGKRVGGEHLGIEQRERRSFAPVIGSGVVATAHGVPVHRRAGCCIGGYDVVG